MELLFLEQPCSFFFVGRDCFEKNGGPCRISVRGVSTIRVGQRYHESSSLIYRGFLLAMISCGRCRPIFRSARITEIFGGRYTGPSVCSRALSEFDSSAGMALRNVCHGTRVACEAIYLLISAGMERRDCSLNTRPNKTLQAAAATLVSSTAL